MKKSSRRYDASSTTNVTAGDNGIAAQVGTEVHAMATFFRARCDRG